MSDTTSFGTILVQLTQVSIANTKVNFIKQNFQFTEYGKCLSPFTQDAFTFIRANNMVHGSILIAIASSWQKGT